MIDHLNYHYIFVGKLLINFHFMQHTVKFLTFLSFRVTASSGFDLREGGQSYGGYSLVYYGDDKASAVRGKVALDTITDIRKVKCMHTLYNLFLFFFYGVKFYKYSTCIIHVYIPVLTRAVLKKFEQ